ncbi:Pectinesterase domain-containing protein/PMEI domain-containing protein, partial [Cephalotus follicularis]
MVVGVAVGVGRGNSSSSGTGSSSGEISTSTKMIKTICQPTDYKQACEDSLNSAHPNTSDPKELIRIGFQVTVKSINEAIENSTTLKELAKDKRTSGALAVCKDLMNDAIDDLQKSFDHLGDFDITKLDDYVEDLKVWLSASYTYEETCIDAFENTTGDAGERMKKILETSRHLTANALSMVDGLASMLKDLSIPNMSRRLLSEDEMPSWVHPGRRSLLQATPANIKADLIIAKDGSGKYKTFSEAMKDIPIKSQKTFVIYLKAGVYEETVLFNKSMTNIMLIGDGPTKSKITFNKNFIDGTNTVNTSTVTVQGANFMAKNIGFENSAGAAKHQAVALRVAADMAIFYNCQMDGYQDTLYTHTGRQFYRDCLVSGTIDFIFGNGVVVFQNCKMVVRKPLENQQCLVTAHGRALQTDPTGLVLQNCVISGDPAYIPVKDQNKAYLGRPWKTYARTIIMQSQIDDIIAPEGWFPWMGTFALDTCFYAEYQNRGAGAATTKRVTWRGIKHITPDHIVDFTPARFIAGDLWVKPTGVPYVSGMMT